MQSDRHGRREITAIPCILEPDLQARIIVKIPAAGRLYVVATPIGNMGDLSERARAMLQACSAVAAEDTRHSGALLAHLGLKKPLVSLHEHNEAQRAPQLVERLQRGESIALVSDAGTPAISDPGYDLVRLAAAAGIEVLAVPGPCAAVAALSIGGLPTSRFCFEGFLPARGSARRTRLAQLERETRTLVFYEAPHRLLETLQDCVATFGATRSAVVAREISKLHETTYRGSLAELSGRAATDEDFARGELVLVVAGAVALDEGEGGSDGHGGTLDKALLVLMVDLPLRQAAHLAARIAGARENAAYKRALSLRQGGGDTR